MQLHRTCARCRLLNFPLIGRSWAVALCIDADEVQEWTKVRGRKFQGASRVDVPIGGISSRVSATVTRPATIEGTGACAAIKIAKETGIVCLSMVIHVEVDT